MYISLQDKKSKRSHKIVKSRIFSVIFHVDGFYGRVPVCYVGFYELFVLWAGSTVHILVGSGGRGCNG